MKPHQTDHAADRFARLHAAADAPSDSRGQFQMDTATGFALIQEHTEDGARIVAEREQRERAAAEARQQSLF